MAISKKKQQEILKAIMQAFCDVTKKYECYDYPPETWDDSEKELWDDLAELTTKAQENVRIIIENKQIKNE